MTNLKEIELKLFIGNDTDILLEKFKARGMNVIGESEQKDIYFTSLHKDFLASEECLRIRSSPSGDVVTWKPPTTDSMRTHDQFWKEELDIDITGQVEQIRRLLTVLDFKEVVTVVKHRRVFRVDAETTVSLDIIASLGGFIEIETIGSIEEAGTRKNEAILTELDLSGYPKIDVPYRDLVLEGRIYTSAGRKQK